MLYTSITCSGLLRFSAFLNWINKLPYRSLLSESILCEGEEEEEEEEEDDDDDDEEEEEEVVFIGRSDENRRREGPQVVLC